jgi:hypothetical protein
MAAAMGAGPAAAGGWRLRPTADWRRLAAGAWHGEAQTSRNRGEEEIVSWCEKEAQAEESATASELTCEQPPR